MEEDKIYLDLEPTAEQVKKSIEEIVEKLTEDVVENKDNIFTLEVDTENMPEGFDGALTDEMLDKVKIRLKTVSAISPVKGKLGQMIMSDGDEWIKKSEFYTSLFSCSLSKAFFLSSILALLAKLCAFVTLSVANIASSILSFLIS